MCIPKRQAHTLSGTPRPIFASTSQDLLATHWRAEAGSANGEPWQFSRKDGKDIADDGVPHGSRAFGFDEESLRSIRSKDKIEIRTPKPLQKRHTSRTQRTKKSRKLKNSNVSSVHVNNRLRFSDSAGEAGSSFTTLASPMSGNTETPASSTFPEVGPDLLYAAPKARKAQNVRGTDRHSLKPRTSQEKRHTFAHLSFEKQGWGNQTRLNFKPVIQSEEVTRLSSPGNSDASHLPSRSLFDRSAEKEAFGSAPVQSMRGTFSGPRSLWDDTGPRSLFQSCVLSAPAESENEYGQASFDRRHVLDKSDFDKVDRREWLYGDMFKADEGDCFAKIDCDPS